MKLLKVQLFQKKPDPTHLLGMKREGIIKHITYQISHIIPFQNLKVSSLKYCYHITIRPLEARRCSTSTFVIHSLIKSSSSSPAFTTLPCPNGWKQCFESDNRLCCTGLGHSRSQRILRWHHWVKNNGNFAEWLDNTMERQNWGYNYNFFQHTNNENQTSFFFYKKTPS